MSKIFSIKNLKCGITSADWLPTKVNCGFTLAEGATHVNLPPTKVKCGFTLAEVLITLGIIGVVAAITIPTLIHTYYEKQTVSRLLETTSILSQAIKTSEEEYGELGSWGTPSFTPEYGELVFNNLKPFMKVANICGIVDDKEQCFANRYALLHNKGYTGYNQVKQKYKFTLLNGSAVSVQGVSSNNNLQINVDVNGVSKPNIMGKDLFLFTYDAEKRSLLPMGHPDSMYPYDTNCVAKDGTGYGCAYYVLKFKDMKYLK